MKLKPQGRFEGSWLGRLIQSRMGVIASNWILQGMRYMNGYEISIKLILDLMLVLFLVAIFDWWGSAIWIFLAFVIAHTLNWVLNGHFFVLMRYVRPISKKPREFDEQVRILKQNAINNSYIDGVAVYGSYCRGQLHEYSDLDVRVIVTTGFVNGIAGALFCVKERMLAFFRVFPLDIYCCAEMGCLDRLREDEFPVVLLDRSGLLKKRYSVGDATWDCRNDKEI